MSRPRRPVLYAFEASRRQRRPLRPSLRPLAILALLLAGLLALAVAVALERVLPLTHRAEGVIPPAARTSTPTAPDATTPSGLPDLFDDGASHRPIAGVRAAGAIVVDRASGRVLWEHRPHARRPVASLTKLMTALLAPRRLDERLRVPRDVLAVPGFRIGLVPGQRLSVRRLLAAMLIPSANDAATALAVDVAGSERRFVRRMNVAARRFGLRDTRYASASGIVDRGSHSTAWDVAALARRFLARRPLARLVRTRAFSTSARTAYISRNRLLWTYPGATGIKTGFTDAAGNCLAASARRRGHTLVGVLLGVRGDPFAAGARLLDWGFRHVRRA